MTKFTKTQDTIDAAQADGMARKIEWKGLRKHPVINKQMTLYECDRNSFVKIVKEYEGEIEKGTELYNRTLGDCLEADAISIYIDRKRKIKTDVAGGVTGRHSSQEFKIRDRSISTIKTPLSNLIAYLNLIEEDSSKNNQINLE